MTKALVNYMTCAILVLRDFSSARKVDLLFQLMICICYIVQRLQNYIFGKPGKIWLFYKEIYVTFFFLF